MTVETELRALLLADPAVAALVGDRVSADNIDQKAARPFVVYRRTDTDRTYALEGTLIGSMATITLQCWAESRLAADEVADACEAPLIAQQQGPTNREADSDPELDLYVTQFVIQWWE